ncbi:MAG: hypothetical protein Q8N53_13205 [Longimicrobiales bacterium]|nr:hypothetical protein [Longimicrobiales bacterium]
MAKFVWMGIVLQLAMVTGGHFSAALLDLSAVLGTGIPFVLGFWYGATVPKAYMESAKGGFILGIAGALIGVLAAILMGDQTWMLLTFAPISSGITGTMGAAIGTLAGVRGKGRK